MSRYAAYCGLYCGACCSMIRQEQEKGEPSALEMKVDPEESSCQGCNADSQDTCEFVQCNKEHGTESCAFCPEYPCAMIEKFSTEEWEHHQVVLDNLNRIREIGIDAWLSEQKVRWTCQACGKRTQWYESVCAKCGVKIENYL